MGQKNGILSSITSALYKASKVCGKTASTTNTINTILTGDPKKIAKNLMRKGIYKTSNRVANNISKKV